MPDRGERIVALEKAVIEAGGAGGGKGKTIEVQYNPLSLKIRAESRGTVMSGLLAAQEEGDIWQAVSAEGTSLSFELIFAGEETKARVEELLSLLKDRAARQVDFCWGRISFQGEIERMSVCYDMFSEEGDPVSAKASLVILQAGDGAQGDGYWEDTFERFLSQ